MLTMKRTMNKTVMMYLILKAKRKITLRKL